MNSKPLVLYVTAATLCRTVTGASPLAVILLAKESNASGVLVGLFSTCLTLPHLLGPVYGRWLDTSRMPLAIICYAVFIYACCFVLSVYGFAVRAHSISGVSLMLCGICSAFLMGGLSTQLTHIVPNNTQRKRVSQSWDTVTYAIGSTLGPLIFALLAKHASLHSAAYSLVTLVVIAGLILSRLAKPVNTEEKSHKESMSITEVTRVLATSIALKRTLIMTSSLSFCLASLPVFAVYFCEYGLANKEKGAYLVTAFGFGNFVSAIWLIVRPLKGEALLMLRDYGSGLLLCITLIGISQNFEITLFGYFLVGVLNALFFTASLAARTEYAPPRGASQIYMWVAATKIGTGSMGALCAGVLIDSYLYLPIIVALVVLAVGLFIAGRNPA